MDRALLMIVAIVGVVGAVGILTSYNFLAGQDAIDSPTGNVVASSQQCGSCAGNQPVCAQVNNRLITFQNACEAQCANAKIAADIPCERIPHS